MKALLLSRWESDRDTEVENSAETLQSVCRDKGFEVGELHDRIGDRILPDLIDALCGCDFVIAILTEGTKTLHFEIGFARALGKQIVFVQADRETVADETHIYLAQDNLVRYRLGSFRDLRRKLGPRLDQLRSEPDAKRKAIAPLARTARTLASLEYPHGLYSDMQAFLAQAFLQSAAEWTDEGPLRVKGRHDVLIVGTEILRRIRTKGFVTMYYPGRNSWSEDRDPDTADRYFHEAKLAVERGADIERVYVLDDANDGETDEFRDMVRRDVAYGITTRYLVVDRDWLDRNPDLRDFGIWDNQLLARVRLSDPAGTMEQPIITTCEYSPLKDGRLADGQDVSSWEGLIRSMKPKPAPALPLEMTLLEEFHDDIVSTAEQHCRQYRCEAYHGSWPMLRLLRGVSTPGWHAEFYVNHFRKWYDTLSNNAGERPPRVLISGMADFGMLYHIVQAIGVDRAARVEFDLLDRCRTPIEACRALRGKLQNEKGAAHVDLNLVGKIVDLLDHEAMRREHVEDGKYDLVCSDAFLTRTQDFLGKVFTPENVLAIWERLLRPGGVLITTARIMAQFGPDITDDLRKDFVNRMVAEAGTRSRVRVLPFSHMPREQVESVAKRYAEFITSEPFADSHAIVQLLDRFPTLKPSQFFSIEDFGRVDGGERRLAIARLSKSEMVSDPLYARISVRKEGA
jgi:SAM-dependent methyltransferase